MQDKWYEPSHLLFSMPLMYFMVCLCVRVFLPLPFFLSAAMICKGPEPLTIHEQLQLLFHMYSENGPVMALLVLTLVNIVPYILLIPVLVSKHAQYAHMHMHTNMHMLPPTHPPIHTHTHTHTHIHTTTRSTASE